MRAARRRWAGGVAVVLVRTQAGYRGATVGAFAAVSLDPPLVLVCLDRGGALAALVPALGTFAVSVLDRRHEFLAERFAGRAPLADPHLTGIPHQLTSAGDPVLADVTAWFDCRVHAVHDGGDHAIVVGAVQAIGLGEETDDPLLYFDGRYGAIEAGS